MKKVLQSRESILGYALLVVGLAIAGVLSVILLSIQSYLTYKRDHSSNEALAFLVFALVSLYGFWEALTLFKSPVNKFIIVFGSFIPALVLAYKADQLLTMVIAVLCATCGSVIVTTPKRARPVTGNTLGN